MKKRKKILSRKVTVEEYMKAIKNADREIQQSQSPGWIATHKIHPSKKAYNRRRNKSIEE